MKNIVVLGDPMIDRYLHLEPSGIAQEAPIAKYRMTSPYLSEYPGGASNVAHQIRLLVENLDVAVREFPGPQRGDDRIVKTRGISGNIEVFRFDHDYPAPPIQQHDVDRLTKNMDLLVISDYEKGALAHGLTWPEVPTLIDCKDPTKYPIRSTTVCFPNVKEFMENSYFSDYVCLVTAGSRGAALSMGVASTPSKLIESPAPTNMPLSVVGAGDVVVAAFAVAQILGFSHVDCSKIAVACASIAVQKPFTPNVTIEDLEDASEFLPFNHPLQDFIIALEPRGNPTN